MLSTFLEKPPVLPARPLGKHFTLYIMRILIIILAYISENLTDCFPCTIPIDNHKILPTHQFYKFLAMFLISKPSISCPYGGLGKYQHLLTITNHNSVNYMIEAFHYHLNTTEDHIRSIQSARTFARILTEYMHNHLLKLGLMDEKDIQKVKVFPYSPHYDYYNQYIDIWSWIYIVIATSIVSMFLVHFLFGGLHLLVSLCLASAVYKIAIQMIGLMYQLDVGATERSVVFVLICIGFSTRFFLFFMDRFAISMQKLRGERQANALQTMFRPLLWGVIANKLFWLWPMLMARPKYIRLLVGMTLSGCFFGLFYIPTFFYFLG